MGSEIRLEGRGLHGGQGSSVRLVPAPGPLRFGAAGDLLPLERLVLGDTLRSTSVRAGGSIVRTVEHLFAALAGLGIHEGLRVEIDGAELPLLGGGAREYAVALATLELPPRLPWLRVARAATFDVEGSQYVFEPGEGVEVRVALELDDPRLARDAVWRGEPRDFIDRIAPARTFAFARDLPELLRESLAMGAAPESVVVIAAEIHAQGVFEPDEPARHKLLDLLGDAYLYGGPPRGRMHATRPGHARNHVAFRRALDASVLQLVVS